MPSSQERSPQQSVFVVQPPPSRVKERVSTCSSVMVRSSVPMVEVRVGSLCLLSPGCVEVGTGLSSALSLLLIISVS